MHIGTFVFRWRWVILAAWIVAGVGLFVFVPAGDPAANERSSFLPENSPYRVAMKQLAESFPAQAGLSKGMIVFERRNGPLSLQDNAYINGIAMKVKAPLPGRTPPRDLQRVSVSSPGLIDAALLAARGADTLRNGNLLKLLLPSRDKKTRSKLNNPMRSDPSASGQAAIVRVNIPVGFVTYRSTQIIRHIRAVLERNPPPEGLSVAVTGTGGYGYDYAQFIAESYDRTMYATLIAVVIILLLVYRAPIAAAVPLLAIGFASAIVIKLMNIAQNLGFSIGMSERIFVFVLMYGAGIDYSLLLISRYREFLRQGRISPDAGAEALHNTFPAISASAATDSIGILMLVFSQFLIFKTTGPIVAVAFAVAMLAAITLVPALVGILGPKMFWPARPGPAAILCPPPWWRRAFNPWPAIAKFVTTRPGLVMVVTLAALAIPAVRSTKITWVYDALSGIDSSYTNSVGNAAAGVDISKRHWPIGEVAPVEIMLQSDRKLTPRQWRKLSRAVTTALHNVDEIQNVRSLTQPLGERTRLDHKSPAQRIIGRFAAKEYLGLQRKVMRLEAIMGMQTMSNDAMDLADNLRIVIAKCLKDQNAPDIRIHLAGATAQMIEVRSVTQRDFKRLVVLVLSVIFVIVLFLLRDLPLTIFMVTAICISYLATLGLCSWAFVWLFDQNSIDWKVQVFLFVVMAAVGVDYNIFLAARLSQEARHAPPRQAVCQAVIHTGPVISSCGIIMAATLGSLMVGHIELLKQLGFALGLGMLVDTFVVRPLLLPAFAALFKRTGRGKKLAA